MGCLLRGCLSIVVLIVALVVVAFALTHSVLGNYRVFGNAMAPALRSGDFVIVDKVSYRFHSPNRGDIVVFTRSAEPSRTFIMRVIGLAGDRVTLRRRGDSLEEYVNGHMDSESRGNGGTAGKSLTGCGRPTCTYTVPSHHVFVLGDNWANSFDSRLMGPVPENRVIGRVLFSYWHSRA